jgi:ATP-dependent DNA helicase PIF1
MDERLQRLRRAVSNGDHEARSRLAIEEGRLGLPPFDRPETRDLGEMTPSQIVALKSILLGENVFLSGAAGTGKSFLLQAVIRILRAQDRNVAVTAPTGLAASLLDGMTIHRWSGCRLGDVDPDGMPRRWHRYRAPVIRATDVLLIDEISMLDARLLNLVEALVRTAKSSQVPWGGLQLVVVGDFAQLPPVKAEQGFAFESLAWHSARLTLVTLTEIVRQQDPAFVRILAEARYGALSSESLKGLESRVGAVDSNDYSVLRLVTHRGQAARANSQKLQALVTNGAVQHLYRAIDWFQDRSYAERLDRRSRLAGSLALAVGARVLLASNDRAGRWCNGSQGVVEELRAETAIVRLDATGGPVEVERVSEEVYDMQIEHRECLDSRDCRCPIERVPVARRSQLPIRLGWAVTIHRAQGATLDSVSLDLSKIFSAGQAYVAISRVRTLKGLNIERWRGRDSFWLDPIVGEFLGVGGASGRVEPAPSQRRRWL